MPPKSPMLNAKKYKHIRSDDKTTILRHEDGHEITIAHNALKGDTRKLVEALKNGKKDDEYGKVEVRDTEDKRLGKVKVEEDDSDEQADYGKVIKMAFGGSPEEMVDDMVPDVMSMPAKKLDPAREAREEAYNRIVGSQGKTDRFGMPIDTDEQLGSMFGSSGEAPKDFDSKAFVKAIGEQKKDEQAKTASAGGDAAKIAAENQVRLAANLPPLPMPQDGLAMAPNTSPPAQGIAPAGLAPQQGANAAPGVASPNDPMAMLQSGMQKQMAGINAQAKAQGDLGNQQAAALMEAHKADQEALQAYNDTRSSLQNERDALLQDIRDGQVSPDKFWTGDPKTGEGGHSRIATGIGIILAGFNPTNSPNAAINFLNQQMDRNLQAQAKNLGSKENLLSANMQQFGDLKAATEMTRIMQNDMLSNQLQTAAATAQNPLAKAAALRASGELQAANAVTADKFYKTYTTQKLMQQAGSDPSKIPAFLSALQATDPEKAKDFQQRLVPGVGFANTKDDADALKETSARKDLIKSNAARAISMIQKNGTYEAFGPHNATLNGLADQIATDMAKLQDPNSVARPGEVEIVKRSLIESGLGTMNSTAEQQLKSFLGTVDDRANKAFTTRGMKLPQSQEAQPDGETTANVTKDGKTVVYRKVGNKGVRVK